MNVLCACTFCAMCILIKNSLATVDAAAADSVNAASAIAATVRLPITSIR